MKLYLKYAFYTTIALIGVVALSVSAQTANRYMCNAQDVSYLAASRSIFSDAELMSLDACDSESIDITVGSEDPYIYTHINGYVWNEENVGGDWHRLAYKCEGELIGGWCTGEAKAKIKEPKEESTYIALSYSCEYLEENWKCGCKDEACETQEWNAINIDTSEQTEESEQEQTQEQESTQEQTQEQSQDESGAGSEETSQDATE